jgi:hypothetical protein
VLHGSLDVPYDHHHVPVVGLDRADEPHEVIPGDLLIDGEPVILEPPGNHPSAPFRVPLAVPKPGGDRLRRVLRLTQPRVQPGLS